MPMRVRNPLQQHAVSQLSGETEEDTELSGSFRPLAPLSSSASGVHFLATRTCLASC